MRHLFERNKDFISFFGSYYCPLLRNGGGNLICQEQEKKTRMAMNNCQQTNKKAKRYVHVVMKTKI